MLNDSKMQSTAIAKSPVSQAIDRLRMAHANLAEQVERAHSKFDVALASSQPSTGAKEAPRAKASSQLEETISDAADFMQLQAEMLRDLNDRCTL